jgi:hypothetical protein
MSGTGMAREQPFRRQVQRLGNAATRVKQGQIEGPPGGVRFPAPPPSAQTGPAGLLATAARNAAPSNNFRQTDARQPSPDKSAALSVPSGLPIQ